MLLIGGGVVVLLAVIAILNVVSSDDDDDPTEVIALDDAADDAAASPSTTGTTTDEATATTVAAAPNDECPPEDGSGPQVLQFTAPPPVCIDLDTTYLATLTTTLGDIVIELDPSLDPVSVNNMIVLARYHYYDGVIFHRVIPDFVIQGVIRWAIRPAPVAPATPSTAASPRTPGRSATWPWPTSGAIPPPTARSSS